MTQPLRSAIAAQLLVAVTLLSVCVIGTSAAGAPSVCPGDLNGDGETTVEEIVAAVNAALSGCTPPICPGDLNGDGETTVDEIVAAVNAALTGCTPPMPSTPTRTTSPTGTPTPDSGFEPISVPAAVTKVKNLLVGLPPTDAEVQAVIADESALYGLVGQWMTLPEYNDKMLSFFVTQFQQDQWEYRDLVFQFNGKIPFDVNPAQIVENFEQSFARTALELIAEGQPFTSTMTTTRFMMTPALMAAYAALDHIHVADNYGLVDLFMRDFPTSVTLQSSTMIPIEQAIDPSSPNFMTFYDPTIATPYAADCPYETIVYPAPVEVRVLINFLFNNQPVAFGPANCAPPSIPPSASYIKPADFTTWQMITIRQPEAGESTTPLYDLPAMRAGRDLVLHKPRVSFFTTPAFAARWPTNDDNQARVLANQTLIVALGQPIDLTNTTPPPSLAALNQVHAAPGSICYGCHQSLDPMRQFFRQTYTLYFSQQDNPQQTAIPGGFGFHGVSAAGSRIFDLGALLAAHPMFATAWTQKLCTYATSQHCDETDPEFVRLVETFTSNNYSWNGLVQALFSSPLVTYLHNTKTAGSNGQLFPIARQAHLCATLSSRLGVPDICGLKSTTVPLSKITQNVAASWPSDQYSRGNQTPSLAGDPSLLMRGGMENVCVDLARRLVDNGSGSALRSIDPTVAIQFLVTQLMGLSGGRADGPRAILQDHFTAARRTESASEALKSTVVLACLSPYVTGVGQ